MGFTSGCQSGFLGGASRKAVIPDMGGGERCEPGQWTDGGSDCASHRARHSASVTQGPDYVFLMCDDEYSL